jgi:invasion protein IalB
MWRFDKPTLVALIIIPMSAALAYGQQDVAAAGSGEKPKVEFALRGQREARTISYGDWQKYCFKTPGAALVCRTTISGKWETGQSAVRVDLIEREGEDTKRLQIALPVGLYLQAGAKLSVDQGQPFNIPYVWCFTNTCIAAEQADPALLDQLETGKQLKLEVADTNLLAVSTMLPLDRFASVRRAIPTQTFTQDIEE